MKATLDIDPNLLSRLQNAAKAMGRSLNDVAEEAIRAGLKKGKFPEFRPKRARKKLPVSKKPLGLRRGIDLNNTAALLDVLDQKNGIA